jgi:outer membrane protein
VQTGSTPTGLKVTTPTGTYDVVSPVFAQGGRTGFFTPNSFGTQLRSNFGQNLGLGISVPIFSGGSLRANYQRAQLNVQSLNLQKDQDNLKLKQDIYQAYLAAVTAMQRFEASKKSVEAATRTYDYARKRADVGMLGTFELITNQNNLFRAKLELVSNQFDYVFKMKVLEFYKGQGLKL